MGRSVFGWVCVLALVALPVGGCGDETTATGGSGGSGDTGGDGGTGGMGGGGAGGDAGHGGTGGSDLCEGVTCEDDGIECTGDGVCDPATGTCDYAPVEDGTACDFGGLPGFCEVGICTPRCVANVCQCSEAGVQAAIAEGGGPFTFDCDRPTTVQGFFVISRDVILDGEGRLTLDPSPFLFVGATVELTGFVLTGGSTSSPIVNGGTLTIANSIVTEARGLNAISNDGVLNLVDTTVLGNRVGLSNTGMAVVRNSTISGNTGDGISTYVGGGLPSPTVTIVNSTISGNGGNGIWACGATRTTPAITMLNSTVSGNAENAILLETQSCFGLFDISNSIIDGDCMIEELTATSSHNIESPGDTCGFDPDGTDQVNITKEQLNLGELADNGGPTMTHALLPGSVAIDVIPADMCEVDEDQRGVERPQGDACDVGAVEMEVQP